MADRLAFMPDLCFLSCDVGKSLEGIFVFTDGRETTSLCLRSTDNLSRSFSFFLEDFCSVDVLLAFFFFFSFFDFLAEESSVEQRVTEAVPLLCMLLERSKDSPAATDTSNFLLFRLMSAALEEEVADAKAEGRFETGLGLRDLAIAADRSVCPGGCFCFGRNCFEEVTGAKAGGRFDAGLGLRDSAIIDKCFAS
jgi:hypothetical protein